MNGEKATPETKEFEPVIIGFLCQWCASAAADLAGTARVQYPASIRPIRVQCSSTVDPVYVIRALMSGADGVLIGGCPPGDCHHISGNYKARRRLAMLKTMMQALGLDDDRVCVRWISAAEGAKFADTVKKFTEDIRQKGPSPLKDNWAI